MNAAIEPGLAAELAPRVERGAALLDRAEPGWHLRIARDRLAMESCDRCVLGQLHGDYLKGFRCVLRDLPARNLYSAAEHGFTLHGAEQEAIDPSGTASEQTLARFAALADLWRAQVTRRLAR
jgi:hypothetical protein